MNPNESPSSSTPSTSQLSTNSSIPDLEENQTDHREQGAVQASPTSVNSTRWQGHSLGNRFKPKALWSIVFLIVSVISGVVGWKAYRSLSTADLVVSEEENSPARLPVRVTRVSAGLAQQWVFDEGVVTAVQRRVLKFEANGEIQFITEIEGRNLRAGDVVSQGQLLATIDDRKQIVAIETAEADLQVSIQQVSQARAALLQAEADYDNVQSDVKFADSELVRYGELFDQGALSASQRDTYINSAEKARASLRVAEQSIRAAEDDVRAAASTVEAARSRLREANVDLEDTQLVSPIEGVVAYINIREGEYWDAQRLGNGTDLDTLTETAPIVVIEPQSLEVELELQADEAQSLRPGQQARVVLVENVSAAEARGATNETLLDIAQAKGSLGQVFSVSPTQTPGGRGVEVSIRSFQRAGDLQVGGRVYAWIEAAVSPDAVMVPLGSLLPRDQSTYAFVVDEASGAVERREVQRGIEGLNGIEILSGIEPGELVVTEGINRLVDGTLVEIVSEESSLFSQEVNR